MSGTIFSDLVENEMECQRVKRSKTKGTHRSRNGKQSIASLAFLLDDDLATRVKRQNSEARSTSERVR